MMENLNFQQLWDMVRRWWWLLLLCMLIAGASSYIGTTRMPRIYQATTTIMVGQSLQKANPSSQELYISQQLAQTYAEMVRRRPVLEGTAGVLGLNFVPSPENISTRQVPGTQLLEISVRDTIPERARVLADEIVNQLILQGPTGGEEQERQAFVREQIADLEENIEATRDEIEIERENLEAANSARAIQQYQTNIDALEDKLSSYQSTYASLLDNVEGGTNYISIVEHAGTPMAPISPNVSQTVLLGAVIGLTVATAGILLIEFLDDTVKTPEEALRLTDLSLLGTIAQIDGKAPTDKVITHLNPVSPITEAYRILRTSVKFASIDKPLETLMITSPGPAEGKSVTLANLGVVLAQAGDRVIIVDTDLRRPAQHKLFGLSNETGLTDLILSSDADVLDALQGTSVEGLSVLTSGAIPPNPAELLGSERMTRLMETLKAHADMLLFDCPPALVVTDAVILGAKVDGVLVVNDLNRTRRKMAQKVPDVLKRGRANVLGLVLNRLPAKNGYGYYYMQYYADTNQNRQPEPSPWWQRLFSRNNESGTEPVGSDNGATGEEDARGAMRRSVQRQALEGETTAAD